ncbi:procyclic form-specific polypeptide A-beta-like [Eriocheir sinensis]|uniref:procyclic form-specific polypeptide A-beta-like n=1 Tax=Eriocheir sinensis TaxID=95602 RepID=UPI0021C9FFAE|nr:procyclic form-specific polypeptide A-beta-like [Eriocheir sinensis]
MRYCASVTPGVPFLSPRVCSALLASTGDTTTEASPVPEPEADPRVRPKPRPKPKPRPRPPRLPRPDRRPRPGRG